MQAEQLLPGGGEMGAVIRAFDWSNTPLGDLSTWSHLLSAATMCLNSRLPMAIWWGKDLILLYNDAWRSLLGSSHPTALGRPGREGCLREHRQSFDLLQLLLDDERQQASVRLP